MIHCEGLISGEMVKHDPTFLHSSKGQMTKRLQSDHVLSNHPLQEWQTPSKAPIELLTGEALRAMGWSCSST